MFRDLQSLLLVRSIRPFGQQMPAAAMMPRLYVFVALIVSSLFCGFAAGWRVQAWRYTALEHERQAQQQRDTQKRMDRVDEAAASHEEFKAKESTKHAENVKIAYKIIEREVLRNVCLPDDAVGLLNAAIGRASADSGKPSGAVPRSAGGK